MTKKQGSKRTRTRRSQKGRRAVEKGAAFEDIVADVYRLLDAEVVQNIEVCQKKVDILATFVLPGSTTPHRVIVECKNEKKATSQNQRVMQFAGLLDVARKSGEADSAEIVTAVDWSDQAKGFARSRGIALQTYKQKVSNLINLVPYLRDVIRQYEEVVPERTSEPPLGSYYVEPKATHLADNNSATISSLEKHVCEWLQDANARHMAIVGEYGTGKTSFCRKLAHTLASAYVSSAGSGRIPILFSLRDFTKAVTLEAMITTFLDGTCGVANPRFQLFKAMNEVGTFLLIFDGFDEMAVRVDADTLEMNLREIEKLAVNKNSKIVLTSRSEYFMSAEEQARVLRPKVQLLATRDVEYQAVKIHPWDDDKVELFLKKRVPLVPGTKRDWTFYRDQLKKILGLSDLAKRPVLLEMIVKTLPQLVTSGEPINRPQLYHTYLIGELKRQKVVKQRILLLPDVTRLKILQDLAAQFYLRDELAISFPEAMNHVEAGVHPPRAELEAHTRDFLNCSFLIRERDEFRFSHRSIMEYLMARALHEEIRTRTPRALTTRRIDPVVADFIAEMKPNAHTLWEWIGQTKATVNQLTYLGGNAVSILCVQDERSFINRDLSGTNLTGARFSTADLTRPI